MQIIFQIGWVFYIFHRNIFSLSLVWVLRNSFWSSSHLWHWKELSIEYSESVDISMIHDWWCCQLLGILSLLLLREFSGRFLSIWWLAGLGLDIFRWPEMLDWKLTPWPWNNYDLHNWNYKDANTKFPLLIHETSVAQSLTCH